ncbi:uracil-DNA glycosylase [Hirschia baltica]|uniref:Type-5 uracil-DNA glycosylase n=1 Tax=Hirschia baltica (strain ATCC 49814 / DSM 5838 / IFAM 1418) TaxID=582402 RepID=C6XJF7_HIRBI|nr:uracil-DNA glycosylase [Hirschia baltica]ACT59252.1 Uracil-DNA glycosylase superfamily [Hirschia baltica ATCC 49814]
MTENFPPEAPSDCDRCPRLVEYLEEYRAKEPNWFNAPVPSFGPSNAKLLIVGLAPGVTGANRTARPFTGDYAGDLLYATIEKFGFSKGKYDSRSDDGLELVDAMITNAVRCVPPQNKPTGPEINNCRPFLVSRMQHLPQLKVILALGKIAHDSTVRTLGGKLSNYKFAHAAIHKLNGPNGALTMIDSYHCSRYNTNTGRLTTEMFENVFSRIQSEIQKQKAAL